MMRKSKNKNRFWKIYGITAGAVAVVILFGLFVFYDFIGAYEASQPQNVAEKYLSELTEDKIVDMASSAIAELGMKYENPDRYIEEYRKAWTENTPVCQKSIAKSTSEVPVYSIMSGDIEVCRLTFVESGNGKYGFQEWETKSCEFPIDTITEKGVEYSLYVPDGAELTVNGIVPTVEAENVPFPTVSELETAELSSCTYYELGVLYNEPEIKCTVDSSECTVLKQDGMILCAMPGSEVRNYVIEAPGNALVLVNDVLLSEKYVKEAAVPYEYSEFEASTDSLPTLTVYETGDLFSEPTVSVILDNQEINTTLNGNKFTATYPENLMYTVTVKAPQGTMITLNGKTLGEPTSTERAFEGLLAETVSVPIYDVYTVSRLFSPAESVTGTLDGEEVTFSSVTNVGDGGHEQVFTLDISDAIDSSVADFAMDFTKAYFHYTSQGYKNIDRNLAAVLGYVQPNSELYAKIRDSKIGYDYVTPVTSETYKQLEATSAYHLDDGSSVIKIAFDVDQIIVYVNRTYAGEILLHIVGSGDNMKVAAMVIDNK